MESLFYLDPRVALRSPEDDVWGMAEFCLCWAFFTIKEFDKNVGRWYFPGMFF